MIVPTHHRAMFFLIIGTLTFSVVFIAQYGFGFQPCALCLWQRLPWSFLILLALCDWLLWREQFMLWLGYSIVMAFSAILAFYHIGVEHGFWESFLAACKPQSSQGTAEDFILSLQNPIKSIPCDERVIFLFDFSFADWNFLLSLGLSLFALLPFMTGSKSAR